MATTGVSSRAIFVLRYYEMRKVFSATSKITATRQYRNETWCRRWWSISQRSVSTSAISFVSRINPHLNKDRQKGAVRDVKEPSLPPPASSSTKESQNASLKSDKTSKNEETVSAESEELKNQATVEYYRGLPKIIVPLPSRRERCQFTLKPITHTVGDLVEMLKQEDRGIDRASLTTIDGVRIGASNTIESLLEEDFKIIINDNIYTVTPPYNLDRPLDDLQKLSDVQALVTQLYESFNAREYQAEMERHVLTQLEDVKLELEPLEQQRIDLENAATTRAHFTMWVGLVLMSIQFGVLARLTWWEYSWDIMEPVTYFVTYGTAMVAYMYYLVTKQEYMLPDFLDRQQLLKLHKTAKKRGFDLNRYNVLKDQAYELETTLKILRGPLYHHKQVIEEKRKQRSRSSSSSSSRSPSSSPSPSPERSLPKKTVIKN